MDSIRVTQGWLSAGGEQRELLRKESEKRGAAVLERIARAGKVVVAVLPGYDPAAVEAEALRASPWDVPDFPEIGAPATPEVEALAKRLKAAYLEATRQHDVAHRRLWDQWRELRVAEREQRPTVPAERLRLMDFAKRRAAYFVLGAADVEEVATILRWANYGLQVAAHYPGGAERLRTVAQTLPEGTAKASLLATAEELATRANGARSWGDARLKEAQAEVQLIERVLAGLLLEEK